MGEETGLKSGSNEEESEKFRNSPSENESCLVRLKCSCSGVEREGVVKVSLRVTSLDGKIPSLCPPLPRPQKENFSEMEARRRALVCMSSLDLGFVWRTNARSESKKTKKEIKFYAMDDKTAVSVVYCVQDFALAIVQPKIPDWPV